ncbi:MAG: sigma-70 family RNA polymerase sigma factor [Actinomycetota bacterium]|nr:sigma-70 family RNA polymerase sigma factor [Actinomycetota bacterium]
MPTEGAMQEPDPQVVGAARRGDIDAFEVLVRRYQGDVWRLALHLMHDDSLADDVTQEAFVRAFRFLPRYRGDAKFSTWLFTIARNCANDELRRSGRRKNLRVRLDQERPRAPADESVALEVREAVTALPMDLREPVVLIDMFGASYAEVARILGTPVGTVKSRVHRARATLARSLLTQRGERTGEG